MSEETNKLNQEEVGTEAEAPEQAEQTQQAAETAEKDPAAQLEAMKAKLEAAEKAADAAKDQLLRTAAEYENFRKRSAREQDSAFGNGVSHAVNQILGILDTLEMAANAPTTDEAYKKVL